MLLTYSYFCQFSHCLGLDDLELFYSNDQFGFKETLMLSVAPSWRFWDFELTEAANNKMSNLWV